MKIRIIKHRQVGMQLWPVGTIIDVGTYGSLAVLGQSMIEEGAAVDADAPPVPETTPTPETVSLALPATEKAVAQPPKAEARPTAQKATTGPAEKRAAGR